MAITHSTAARNKIADEVTALLDAGGAGSLVIGTTGMGATLATIALSATSFGAASGGVCTLSGTPLEGTASGTGTAAACQLKDGGGTVVITGTVTATGGGGDVTLVSTSITTGEVVRITSGTYTAPT